jgi:hypothetical protein
MVGKDESLMEVGLAAVFAQEEPTGGFAYFVGGEGAQSLGVCLRGQKEEGTGLYGSIWREGLPRTEADSLGFVSLCHLGYAGMDIARAYVR